MHLESCTVVGTLFVILHSVALGDFAKAALCMMHQEAPLTHLNLDAFLETADGIRYTVFRKHDGVCLIQRDGEHK